MSYYDIDSILTDAEVPSFFLADVLGLFILRRVKRGEADMCHSESSLQV